MSDLNYVLLGIDLRDQDVCLTLVKERTGLDASDSRLLLEASAGTTPEGVTIYRPWYTAARLLSVRKTQIVAAEGVTFVNPVDVAKLLVQLQASMDARLKLTVPDGHAATMASLSFTTGSKGVSGTAAVEGTSW